MDIELQILDIRIQSAPHCSVFRKMSITAAITYWGFIRDVDEGGNKERSENVTVSSHFTENKEQQRTLVPHVGLGTTIRFSHNDARARRNLSIAKAKAYQCEWVVRRHIALF